ncbi:MAG TPA: TMEM175 family protein [Ramlibacter sp.]|uniref:TMEM175 family protein n=1 Tax=Ramlibacter sp. TaxID=1917967 RepID=UPI002C5EEB42|nr:TMEM175 family protein [Ramlibacter sp.]HVZ45580.1 TMEM175 family protein [Ramlibacter sp.]
MSEEPRPAGDIGKQRIEALSDGIYAIALTLLVLELKLPPLAEHATNADLGRALSDLLPKILSWVLSFWVMAILWLSQVRIYHLVHSLSHTMVRLELLQLACVSLMPFSTALVGEHGNLPAGAAVYAGNMLAVAVTGALRTRELLHQPHVHAKPIDDTLRRALNRRAYGLPACALTAFVLAFFVPGWNMLAMAGMVLMPPLRRA